MFVCKFLKSGVMRIECLGGYIYVADSEGLDGAEDCKIIKFSGKDKNWYPEYMIGPIHEMYRLTEDYPSWKVKSILAKRFFESNGFKL